MYLATRLTVVVVFARSVDSKCFEKYKKSQLSATVSLNFAAMWPAKHAPKRSTLTNAPSDCTYRYTASFLYTSLIDLTLRFLCYCIFYYCIYRCCCIKIIFPLWTFYWYNNKKSNTLLSWKWQLRDPNLNNYALKRCWVLWGLCRSLHTALQTQWGRNLNLE